MPLNNKQTIKLIKSQKKEHIYIYIYIYIYMYVYIWRKRERKRYVCTLELLKKSFTKLNLVWHKVRCIDNWAYNNDLLAELANHHILYNFQGQKNEAPSEGSTH